MGARVIAMNDILVIMVASIQHSSVYCKIYQNKIKMEK